MPRICAACDEIVGREGSWSDRLDAFECHARRGLRCNPAKLLVDPRRTTLGLVEKSRAALLQSLAKWAQRLPVTIELLIYSQFIALVVAALVALLALRVAARPADACVG